MKTNTYLNRVTQMLLVGAFLCASPLALAEGKHEEKSARLEGHSQLAPPPNVTKDSVRQRLHQLRIADPRHRRVFVDFDALLIAGYDPLLLDTWLDDIYAGVVVIGMPDELVLDYYGQPIFTNAIVYDGAPAQVWGIRLPSARIEKVTVADGKIVRVRS